MARWTLKQAKNHLSAIADRLRSGGRHIDKSAIVMRRGRSVLATLTKYNDIKMEIPADRKSRRGTLKL